MQSLADKLAKQNLEASQTQDSEDSQEDTPETFDPMSAEHQLAAIAAQADEEDLETPQQPPGVYSGHAGAIQAPNNTLYQWPMAEPFDFTQVQERHQEFIKGYLEDLVERQLAYIVEEPESKDEE